MVLPPEAPPAELALPEPALPELALWAPPLPELALWAPPLPELALWAPPLPEVALSALLVSELLPPAAGVVVVLGCEQAARAVVERNAAAMNAAPRVNAVTTCSLLGG